MSWLYSCDQVDLVAKTCTYNALQLDEFPCIHAIKSCRFRNLSIYPFCSRYYTNATTLLAYGIPIVPIPHTSDWDRIVPNNVKNVIVIAPTTVKKRGRPRNKRIPSQGEDSSGSKSRRKCGSCGGYGHNKATCKGTKLV